MASFKDSENQSSFGRPHLFTWKIHNQLMFLDGSRLRGLYQMCFVYQVYSKMWSFCKIILADSSSFFASPQYPHPATASVSSNPNFASVSLWWQRPCKGQHQCFHWWPQWGCHLRLDQLNEKKTLIFFFVTETKTWLNSATPWISQEAKQLKRQWFMQECISFNVMHITNSIPNLAKSLLSLLNHPLGNAVLWQKMHCQAWIFWHLFGTF